MVQLGQHSSTNHGQQVSWQMHSTQRCVYNNCRCSGATFSITTLAACLKVFELNQAHKHM